jgi:FHS family L-fucose permease-like MFS transporter
MGGFLSVMFPTVFGLSIENLEDFTEKGSALLNFAIVGGAVFPPLQGLIADTSGIDLSYIVPALCVLVVTLYGLFARRQNLRSLHVERARQQA